MRRLLGLVVTLAALTLAVGPSRAETAPADPPASAKKPRAKLPPYKLVRILPETHQALLLDKKRGKHVLVDVGEAVGGYEVTEIDEEHVVLAHAKGADAREYVLVLGESTPTPRLSDPYPIPDPAPAAGSPGSAGSPLLDPYPAGVLDPYGSEGVREVQAPSGQRASDDPPPPRPEPKVAEPTPVVVVPEPVVTSFTVPRKRLDAALSDFSRIEREVAMTLTADGVRLDKVAKESFFFDMGLRDGDVVKKVDGTAIRGLDDAALVYARLGKAKKFSVEIVRGGAPLSLRYQITK
jgi:type II secretory pathway component PulC